MGWFAGMALLPMMKSEVNFFVEHMWFPYCVCCGLAILGGLLMLCIQRVSVRPGFHLVVNDINTSK